MKTQERRHEYESTHDYLVQFFVRTLLLILEAPDDLLDDLEKAINLSSEHKRELKRKLSKVTEEEQP